MRRSVMMQCDLLDLSLRLCADATLVASTAVATATMSEADRIGANVSPQVLKAVVPAAPPLLLAEPGSDLTDAFDGEASSGIDLHLCCAASRLASCILTASFFAVRQVWHQHPGGCVPLLPVSPALPVMCEHRALGANIGIASVPTARGRREFRRSYATSWNISTADTEIDEYREDCSRVKTVRGNKPQEGGQAGALERRESTVNAPGGPNIVYVLPEPVCPYAIIVGFRLSERRLRRGWPREEKADS